MKTTKAASRLPYPGEIRGFLTLVEKTASNIDGLAVYRFLCECGTVVERTVANLSRTNKTASCGCKTSGLIAASRLSHGMSKRGDAGYGTFICWQSMHWRCTNEKRKDFAIYGGRGISICDRWMSFENFLSDMGMRPEGMSLDRKNTNGNYEPSNCRWATPVEQARNRRSNRIIDANGESLPLCEWAERLGVDDGVISARIKDGWNPDIAVTEPARRGLHLKYRPVMASNV